MLETHIGIDIGIGAVVRHLSSLLDAPAVLAPYSRLLVDCNRWIEDPNSIPVVSDAITIPANQNLSGKERHQRLEHYFWPYHDAIRQSFHELRTRRPSPLFLSLHSCTRCLSDGVRRDVDGGTIWHEAEDFAQKLRIRLEAKGLKIGDNVPYSGKGGTFCIDYHTWGSDCPACGLEILNDLIAHKNEQQEWAEILAQVLHEIASSCPPLKG